jgi:hypothetical protein
MQGESRVQDSNTTTRYETSFPSGLKPFLPPCETLSTKIKHGCWAPLKRHHLQQLCRIVSLFARNMTLMCMGTAAAENSCSKTDSCITVLECGYSFFSFTVGIRFHEHQFLEAMDCLHEFRYRPKLGDLPPKWGCGKGSWNFFAS